MAKDIKGIKAALVLLVNGMVQFEMANGDGKLAQELLWKILPNTISYGDEMDYDQLGEDLADLYFEHMQEKFYSREHYEYLTDLYEKRGEVTKAVKIKGGRLTEITQNDIEELLKPDYSNLL